MIEEHSNSLRFAKVSALGLSKTVSSNVSDDQSYPIQKLRAMQDVGGYSTVFRSGGSPCLVLKIASAAMQMIPLNGASVKSFASFHTPECKRGYLSVDDMVWPSYGGRWHLLIFLGSHFSRSTPAAR